MGRPGSRVRRRRFSRPQSAEPEITRGDDRTDHDQDNPENGRGLAERCLVEMFLKHKERNSKCTYRLDSSENRQGKPERGNLIRHV